MIRVLVVDDHQYWRELISEMLDAEGYETVTASNRKEAMALIQTSIKREEYFHLITLDHNLVDSGDNNIGTIDSQAILEHLKKNYPASLSIVVVSGRADTRDVRDYLRNNTRQDSPESPILDIDFVDKNDFSIPEFKQIVGQMVQRVSETQKANQIVRSQVFISYSHQDSKWLDRIKKMLTPALRNNNELVIWDDTYIKKGAKWRDEIDQALLSAKVAVLLVSDNFLNSNFINSVELPTLLDASERDGLIVLWIAISHSMFTESPIQDYQCVNNPDKPLDSLSRKADIDRAIVEICNHIKEATLR